MSVERWIQELGADEPATRRDAARQLGAAGYEARAAEAALGQALSDADAEVRLAATLALGQVGPQTNAVIAALGAALKDADPTVRRAAATTLSEVGPEAVPALTAALHDEDEDVREQAARAVGQGGPAAAGAVPALLDALDGAGPALVGGIAHALVEVRPDPRRFLRELLDATDRAGDAEARRGILDELARLGPIASTVAGEIAASADAPEGVRAMARDLEARYAIQAKEAARREPSLLQRLLKRK